MKTKEICYLCGSEDTTYDSDHMGYTLMSEAINCLTCGYHYYFDTGQHQESIGWITRYNDEGVSVTIPWQYNLEGKYWVWKEFFDFPMWLYRLAELWCKGKASFWGLFA